MRKGLVATAVACLSLAATVPPLCAQTQLGKTAMPVDLTKTNAQFAPAQRDGKINGASPKQPDLNKKLRGTEFKGTKTWTGKNSDLLDKKARYDTANHVSFKNWAGAKSLDYTSKEFRTKRHADSGKLDPRYNRATQRENYLAAKYRDAWTARLGPSGKEMIDFGKQLSMRDINRFQFRSSHSDTDGLPVHVAGGRGDDGAPLEYRLFSNRDSAPRSTGYVRKAPKASSLAETPDDGRTLSLGARGFSKNADASAPEAAPQQPPRMLRRSDLEKLGAPVKSEWKATSRVLD